MNNEPDVTFTLVVVDTDGNGSVSYTVNHGANQAEMSISSAQEGSSGAAGHTDLTHLVPTLGCDPAPSPAPPTNYMNEENTPKATNGDGRAPIPMDTTQEALTYFEDDDVFMAGPLGDSCPDEALRIYRPDRSDDSENARPHPCLLYTSPSPRDRQKSRMPSSA